MPSTVGVGRRPSLNKETLIFGMLAALLAAGVWLLVASRKGWPVSTTHSIVGAIVGFGAVALGTESVEWGQVVTIVASWVASPLTAGIIAYAIFNSIQWWTGNNPVDPPEDDSGPGDLGW